MSQAPNPAPNLAPDALSERQGGAQPDLSPSGRGMVAGVTVAAVPVAPEEMPPALRTMLEAGTRARVLELAGFDYVEDVARALRRTRKALSAIRPDRIRTRTLPDGEVETTVESGGAPDWPIRLEATKQIYALAGLTDRSRPDSDGQSGRPIAVNVFVQGQQAPAADVAVRVAVDG